MPTRKLARVAWLAIALGPVALGVLTAPMVLAETLVTLDVWAGDPNDPNDPNLWHDPNSVLLLEGGEPIPYAITAEVLANDDVGDPNLSHDPNVSQGLGALFVTLRTNFIDPNLVGEPNGIAGPLSVHPCTGLPLDDDVTDIGGSQDLLGDNQAQAFASGERAVIAQGLLTAPSVDGTYHVLVTPQTVSVLAGDLSQGPTGRTADRIALGQGFYVVVGETDLYTLTIYEQRDCGDVIQTPLLSQYPNGMAVTLEAVPYPDEGFNEWCIGDPNYPGDANYYDVDANNPMVLVMTDNYEVLVTWECSGGLGAMLPLATVGIVGAVLLIRRLRLHIVS